MSWIATGIGVGVGGGVISGFGNKGKTTNKWMADPTYKEADNARSDWASNLVNWGNDQNYGAIAPNWDDIWSMARDKVKQYFSGGPTSTGLVDRVKASAARRNMADNPALQSTLGSLGVEQANQLKGMATEEATQKNAFREQGRRTWLDSLMNLSTQKPSGQWIAEPKKGNWADMVGPALSGASGGLMQMGQNNFTSSIIDKMYPKA